MYLRYTDPMMNDPNIKSIIRMLNQCGITIQDEAAETYNCYTLTLEDAVIRYQKKYEQCLDTLGIMTDELFEALTETALGISNAAVDGTEDITYEEEEEEELKSARYDSFFRNDARKLFRKNGTDISIVFGDRNIIKTIRDLHYHSSGTEIDTSGNPIYEIYEFIAKDVSESDESDDERKYNQDVPIAKNSKIVYPYYGLTN